MKNSSVTRSYPHIPILEVWSWLLENSRRRCMTKEVSTNKPTNKWKTQTKSDNWRNQDQNKDWFVRTNRKIRHDQVVGGWVGGWWLGGGTSCTTMMTWMKWPNAVCADPTVAPYALCMRASKCGKGILFKDPIQGPKGPNMGLRSR